MGSTCTTGSTCSTDSRWPLAVPLGHGRRRCCSCCVVPWLPDTTAAGATVVSPHLQRPHHCRALVGVAGRCRRRLQVPSGAQADKRHRLPQQPVGGRHDLLVAGVLGHELLAHFRQAVCATKQTVRSRAGQRGAKLMGAMARSLHASLPACVPSFCPRLPPSPLLVAHKPICGAQTDLWGKGGQRRQKGPEEAKSGVRIGGPAGELRKEAAMTASLAGASVCAPRHCRLCQVPAQSKPSSLPPSKGTVGWGLGF